jgi:hypothetical protein
MSAQRTDTLDHGREPTENLANIIGNQRTSPGFDISPGKFRL